MPFEKGGRADKEGNRFEINCIIYEILKVLNETNYSVVIEALGTDEIGTDILVTTMDGRKEHQQCKARNESMEYWIVSDLKGKGILSAWKLHLSRDESRTVALTSPLACSFLVDLHERANNTSGNVEDFYIEQMEKSDKRFQNFYRGLCRELGLEKGGDIDVSKSINYLKRIFYRQMAEYTLQELIDEYIQFLFSSKKEIVYHALLSLVVMGNVLGKELTQSVLLDFCREQGIMLRLRDGDPRVAPRIDEINREYKASFRPLQGGLIHRKEFEECIQAILNENPLVICGNAGYGKSGCTEAILNYCEQMKLPHIAVKLDRRIPHGNAESWGKELGLPESVAHSLHRISRNENAVIILDQLDALRWTQADSSEALSVCMELIRQVERLNCDRKKNDHHICLPDL